MATSQNRDGGQQFLGNPPGTSMEYFYQVCGMSIETIATDVCDGHIDEHELRQHISDHELLDPWDDPNWLGEQYRVDSAQVITAELPVTSETIRNRLHAFDLMDAESSGSTKNTSVLREMLLQMSPDDL